MLVGLMKVTLLTVTPPPFTTAARWLAYPGLPVSGPGSKNSEPEAEVPVIVTFTADWPGVRLSGAAAAGVTGGGAASWMARTPQELAALQYSWNVHIVMSSLGSTATSEKSPHRCGFESP